jgi:uncharacterized protein YxeA
MKYLLLIATLFIVSCGPIRRESYVLKPENAEKAAEFIKELCEKSNPKSDEEPEDMIRQAESTAFKLYGEKVSEVLENGVWRKE